MNKLIAAIAAKQNPTVVGLDLRLDMLPAELLDKHIAAQGETPEAAGAAILEFNKGILDALQDIVPAVKPQLACHEAFGVPGMIAFAESVKYAKQLGYYIIADAKRGDIGSTSAQYAQAFIGKTRIGNTEYEAFGCDCMTVNPYQGSDNLDPFLDACEAYDRDIFVLVKTSNPSSSDVQDLLVDGKPVYRHIAEQLAALHNRHIGIVVGATHPAQLTELRDAMPDTVFLIPGYGAQGGTAASVAPAFANGGHAIVNNSRDILRAWQKRGGHYAEAARAEALDMREKLQKII
ncbi:MAG: orotidine-5'-phosphate decarboxylase [Oscillospiraceae bacterium]|nr:orotidine-5'-phosphate decarboxylase [Oscillospiraceae bacterium]